MTRTNILRHAGALLTTLLLLAAAASSAETAGFDFGKKAFHNCIGTPADDADTQDGKALKAENGKKGVVGTGRHWLNMRGIYETRFRMKATGLPEGEKTGIVTLTSFCEALRRWSLPGDLSGRKYVAVKEIKEDGKYQTLVVRWLADVGWCRWSVDTPGNCELWLDRMDMVLVKRMSEKEFFLQDTKRESFPMPTPRTGPLRAHITKGFFYDYFMLDLALARIHGLRLTSSSYSTSPSGVLSYPGRPGQRPYSPQELYRNDLIVLAGTDIVHLASHMRAARVEWVKDGGGLLLLGGPRSFGQGAFQVTDVQDILPVSLLNKFDLKREKGLFQPAPGAADHPVLQGIDWSPTMVAPFYHSTTLKKNAKLLLGTPQRPLLVASTVGKGRILCLLTTPMGRDDEAAADERVFWNEPRFVQLMENACRYLITRKGPESPNQWTPPAESEKTAKLIENIESSQMDMDVDTMEMDEDSSLLGDEAPAEAGFKLTPKQVRALTQSGGRQAVPLLLNALPECATPQEAFAIARAVRPHLLPEDFPKLQKAVGSMHVFVQEAALSLLGASDPAKAAPIVRKFLTDPKARLQYAACRAANEGKITALKADLKKLCNGFADTYLKNKTPSYFNGGYFGIGLPPTDVLWAYSESLMALVQMGETGYVPALLDAWGQLHYEEINIRSYLFSPNCKNKPELEWHIRHSRENSEIRPDLDELLIRIHTTLANMPAPLHGEFLKAFKEESRFIRLMRPLRLAEDLAKEKPQSEIAKNLKEIRQHAWTRYMAQKRM